MLIVFIDRVIICVIKIHFRDLNHLVLVKVLKRGGEKH